MRKVWLVLLLIVSVMGDVLAAYWQWGWGVYGTGSVEETARFDWSVLLIGNVSANQETVEYCRNILKINPDHKFFIRTWAIRGTRDITMFDYHYDPSLRKALDEELKRQVDFLVKGIGEKNICGISFCEEMPSHISEFSAVWRVLRNPKAPKPKLKDIEPYQDRIRKELGSDFDPLNREHLKWWCRIYTSMLDGVHRKIKEAAPRIPVFYWQRTNFYTWEMTPRPRPDAFPIYLADILRKGRCDGIFVYSGNPVCFEREGLNFVRKFKIPFFSQISTPSTMRGHSFEAVTGFARTSSPYNMGTFLYCDSESNPKSPRAIPLSLKGKAWWTQLHQMHYFADLHGVNRELTDKILQPDVYFTKEKKSDGSVLLRALIFNRKNIVWYPVHRDRAVLETVWRLNLPDNAEINGRPVQGKIILTGPLSAVLEWNLKNGALADKAEFRIGKRSYTPNPVEHLSQKVFRLRRIEPCFPVLLNAPGKITLKPVHGTLKDPVLTVKGRKAEFKGTVSSGEKLVLYSNGKAELLTENLFGAQTERYCGEGKKGWVIDQKYMFLTASVRLKRGAEYQLNVSGQAENTKLLIYALYDTVENGKKVQKTIRPMLSALESGRSSARIVIPELSGTAGADEVNVLFRFYRLKSQGVLRIRQISLVPGKNNAKSLVWSGDLFKGLTCGDTVTFRDSIPPAMFSKDKDVEIQILP